MHLSCKLLLPFFLLGTSPQAEAKNCFTTTFDIDTSACNSSGSGRFPDFDQVKIFWSTVDAPLGGCGSTCACLPDFVDFYIELRALGNVVLYQDWVLNGGQVRDARIEQKWLGPPQGTTLINRFNTGNPFFCALGSNPDLTSLVAFGNFKKEDFALPIEGFHYVVLKQGGGPFTFQKRFGEMQTDNEQNCGAFTETTVPNESCSVEELNTLPPCTIDELCPTDDSSKKGGKRLM